MVLCTLAFAAETRGAVRLPAEFSRELVVQTPAPTALAFTPAAEMLIATKDGHLLLLPPGGGEPRTILDLSRRICHQGERGLVGMTVDPDFAVNRWIYAYYTRRRSGCGRGAVNRVSRFVMGADGSIDHRSERVLLDGIMSPWNYHLAGDLQFGKDGYLYISVGDGVCHYRTRRCLGRNTAAREDHVLLGKILRVDREGRAPQANGGDRRCAMTGRTRRGLRCREIFATGLRNPFRMAFDPNAAGTRFFINDVGEQRWEEINVGRLGADYGWNRREGRCPVGRSRRCGRTPRGLTDPIFAYRQPGRTRPGHRGCEAITGGAFVPEGAWPDAFAGDYLFADYVCGKIFRLERVGGRYHARDFVTGLGRRSAVHMLFGPAPTGTALYYSSLLADGGGVWRILHTPGNRRPTAGASVSPRYGPVPLDVELDARTSSDPDGDGLTYHWDFGDGARLETREAVVRHAYLTPGVHHAHLVVRDDHGAPSDPRQIRIDAGNSPPEITIAGPTRYRPGARVVLRAAATDPEDGALVGTRLAWTVVLHHEEHTHPYRDGLHGPRIALRAPGRHGPADARATFLRVHVRAVDSWGLGATAHHALRPRPR